MQQNLQQALDEIKGLPLTKTTRSELIQYFHFGSTHYTTPQGLILDVGLFTLALNCPWQLKTVDGDVIKHGEVFMRKREAGLPSPKFDWKVPGANLRDQRLKELVKDTAALAVESVELKANYTFTLYFINGSVLEVMPDLTKQAEVYWQLFSNTGNDFKVGAGAAGIIY
ncbi:hypothetical protein ACFSKU_21225 [Pontibacter silvestris]|uniref:Uncharacterized protein n=1 Tax=Pontibacter silvestris TaxID=2305183 RepID=A0ABW4X5P2_9BACT|nr:hypothetical protein [Pontibacter silvestris]MCC9137924.1 hypothetical protein [Pontibacter silvestris]